MNKTMLWCWRNYPVDTLKAKVYGLLSGVVEGVRAKPFYFQNRGYGLPQYWPEREQEIYNRWLKEC